MLRYHKVDFWYSTIDTTSDVQSMSDKKCDPLLSRALHDSLDNTEYRNIALRCIILHCVTLRFCFPFVKINRTQLHDYSPRIGKIRVNAPSYYIIIINNFSFCILCPSVRAWWGHTIDFYTDTIARRKVNYTSDVQISPCIWNTRKPALPRLYTHKPIRVDIQRCTLTR